MSTTLTFVNSFQKDLLNGKHNFDGTSPNTYKVALFASTSNIAASSTLYSALTNEVANGNGYTTGGATVDPAVTDASSPDTTARLDIPDAAWTSSTITARWAVLYNSSNSAIVAFILLDNTPGDVSSASGTFTVDMPAAGDATSFYRLPLPA